MTQHTSLLRRLALAAALVGFGGVLLALDLANRGLAWQFAWSVTGEEQPIGQARGVVEWLGSLTRPQPNTAPYVPIAHTGEPPFGVNTFLEQEVEPAKREQQVAMIAAAGFTWLRQEFPWQDIEIAGRGDFIDRRNDLNGDETPDPVDAWAKYDHIVALAEQYGLRLQVRLSNPPAWAQTVAGDFAPPADVQDYVRYAVAVAQRYRGRIFHYQIWNEPNIYPEWGEQPVDPQAYTDLLCQTYAALKAVDPAIVVINGTLAPTVALSGRDVSDLVYFQQMYDAGAGACFDIHSMQGYGLNSGPTDRRLRATTINFSRPLYIRDLMVANGDAHKPIWISEAAWSPVLEPDVPRDITGYGGFGLTTLEAAARYMTGAYQRVEREMPFVGVMNIWFFKRATDTERGQVFYYFRMVEPDFTPLPIYDAMHDYIRSATPTLYPGIAQADDYAIAHSGDVRHVTDADAQLGDAVETRAAGFVATGTDVRVRWRADTPVRAALGDGTMLTLPPSDAWQTLTLARSPVVQTWNVALEADTPFTLDSVTVYDRTVANLLPLVSSAAALLLVVIGVVAAALRARGR